MFTKYTKYLIVNVVFFTLVFGVRIAPFPLIIIIAYIFSFSVPLQRGNIYCQTGIQEIKYSKPLTSIDYMKQIHIPFTAVSGSHFYGKPIYCLFKKADICYAILDILFNKYDIYFNLLVIYYKEDILYNKYDIHIIILGNQNNNISLAHQGPTGVFLLLRS